MTAKEFLKETSPNDNYGIRADLNSMRITKHVLEIMRRFAKYHCTEQARVIIEKARTMNDPDSYCGNTGSEYPPDVIVDRNSILNAYDLNNII